MTTTRDDSKSKRHAGDTRDRESADMTATLAGTPAQLGESWNALPPRAAPMGEGDGRENFLSLPRLIRSIQRAEGNVDCFGTKDDCDVTDCVWRAYCFNPLLTKG